MMQTTQMSSALRPCLLRPSRQCRRSVVPRAESKVKPTDEPKAEPGNIGDNLAGKRADQGIPGERAPDFQQAQAFDGPAPETINGRLAMLGALAALAAEFRFGITVKEQLQLAPVSILLTFVIISLASYIPIFRGYTRKEEFANAVFSPKAENWNGRTAMIGFTALIITEALTRKSTVDFWNLPHGVGAGFSGFF